jgi:hypothetical protein
LYSNSFIDVDWNNFCRAKIKAEHVLYEVIYQSRIADIFDIIREYPTTKCAIQDFHVSAEQCANSMLNTISDNRHKERTIRGLEAGIDARVSILIYRPQHTDLHE